MVLKTTLLHLVAMPYVVRKYKTGWRVYTKKPNGGIHHPHSRLPLSRAGAEAQQRALYVHANSGSVGSRPRRRPRSKSVTAK